MKIDLLERRKSALRIGIKINQQDMADTIGISRTQYAFYEQGVFDLDANRYYKLHLKYPNIFELPEDFYDYTINNLKYNMEICKLKQSEVAPHLHYTQGRLSQLFKLDYEYYLYDFKDDIQKLFIPYLIKNRD